MALDTRWKNPQGSDPRSLHLWAQDLIKELRRGEFFTTQIGSGITNAQLAEMAAWTIKMRNAGTTGAAQDATINDLTEETSVDGAADFFPFWDAGGAVMRKAKPANIMRAGGLQLLNSGTVSNAATLDIALTSFTAYRGFVLVLANFVPATDDVELWMRFSTDGGSTFDAASYAHVLTGVMSNGDALANSSNSAAQIVIAGDTTATESVSNVANEGGASVTITLLNPAAAVYSRATYESSWMAADTTFGAAAGGGVLKVAQNTDAVRFLFESGNIASGNWALYGYA